MEGQEEDENTEHALDGHAKEEDVNLWCSAVNECEAEVHQQDCGEDRECEQYAKGDGIGGEANDAIGDGGELIAKVGHHMGRDGCK